LNNTFFVLSKEVGKPSNFILFQLFKRLNVFVESKNVKIRRSTYMVPFSLNVKRRSFLIVKWLIQAAKENKKRIPISEKIAAEILLVLKNSTSSKALKFKALNNKNALKNRSNIHYRW